MLSPKQVKDSPLTAAVTILLMSLALVASPTHAAEGEILNPSKPSPSLYLSDSAVLAHARSDPLPGDTKENAFPITILPFVTGGNTCGYNDDYAVMCPYGNWAPDVVYAYVPVEETNIRIDLCDSDYDTAVFLYNSAAPPYDLIGCNDDFCGPDGYRSAIEYAHVVPGFTYYVVVDGYTSACGDYILRVEDIGPCIPACTEMWEPEGEPDCENEYVDEFNAGCDTYPPVFRSIEPSDHNIRICGTSGWFYLDGHDKKDIDWYEIQIEQPNQVDVFCQADFNVTLRLLDGRAGCGQVQTLDSDDGRWCEGMAAVSAELNLGTYWIVVEPLSGSRTCGLGYRLWIDGYVRAPSAVGEEALATGIRLDSPMPNPSSGAAEIRYILAESGVARVFIHDLRGRLVRTLIHEQVPAGPGHVVWNGKDDTGREVASGVYAVRLITPYGSAERPVLRLR
ncbi:FlgD immunoglobulin-like domain containing protein [Candidatus Eisenbacteria bacterium]|uniref:FlgD immunoglobulin-like domain containing protein n=1 Tax=Eiseniibacteriota bacterium TaxID=2212470 RepID=A0ABV6YL33_UNCEI